MKAMAGMVLLAVVAAAQAGEEENTPCDNVETEAQAHACAAFNKQASERELKSAYDELLQRVHDTFDDKSGVAATMIERLKQAQGLWTQLRDADCNVETLALPSNGKAYQAAWDTCVAQRTDDRSEYLQSILQQ